MLLAIADLAGADWGDKARVAADKLEGSSDTSTVGVRLLSAVKVVFDQLDRAEDAISSDELVTKLIAEPTSEWCDWKNGKGITQNQVARLLKSFRIFPERVRRSAATGRSAATSARGLPTLGNAMSHPGVFEPSHRHKPAWL